MKRQLTDWEKIFANDMTSEGLISNIYRQLIQLNVKKTNNQVKIWAEKLNIFPKRTCRWHMKRYSTLLITREMQLKTTLKYHLTPVRMAIIKKNTNNKCWWGCGEKWTLVHRWQECKLVQPLWKTIWRFLKKLKIKLPYDPAIALLDIYP